MILAGTLYNFIKYRRDEESVRIYGVFAFVSYIASVISGIRIIPEGYFGGGIGAGVFAASVYISVLAASFIFLRKTGKGNLMGATMLTAVCMALLILPLRGGVLDEPAVYVESDEDREAAQMLCDRTYMAGEFAESVFIGETGIPAEDITQKAYGFVTKEEPEFFAEFYYDDGDGNERKQYYKISVNDNGECAVLESRDKTGME